MKKTTRTAGLAVCGLILALATPASAQNENQITDVSPASGAQGTAGLPVTFTLDSDAPPPPPAGVMPDSVTLGSMAGASVTHASQVTVTAVFDIPSGEAVGVKEARVTFTTPHGTLVFSKADAFTVTSGADTPPSITLDPQSQTVESGDPVTFSVTASCSSPLGYRWQKDSVALPGEDQSTSAIAAVAEGDAGNYRCIVTNAFGGATSAVAVLTVEAYTPPAVGSYAVVDTGQDGCYSDSASITPPGPGGAYAGQDAQYSGNQPQYTLGGDGLTVYDHHTGLTWQQSPDTDGDDDIDANDKMTWAQLQALPATLNAVTFGGYRDWRLPSIKELYSLIDFRGTDPPPEGTGTVGLVPFIDTNTFAFAYGDTATGERIIDSQWASDTLYVAGQSLLFGVNFADGRIKGYGLTVGGSDKTFLVICCRGDSGYGENRFVDHGDGTIGDLASGLMWQQGDSVDGMNWEDALAYAEGLELGGYRDWRLPSAKELQSIVDYTRSPDTTSSAAIDPLFSCTSIVNLDGDPDYPFYWSSTTHLSSNGSVGRGVYVVFGRGLGQIDGNIVDIHGAGCQRSDPKDGDPEDYPIAGQGPQGDVQRVFNHVRCVRSGVTEPATDTDGDELTDWYEWDYTSTLTNMTASADDDEDGVSNGDECAAGTIPTDAASNLRITELSTDASEVVVSWTSELGRQYRIECSTNLLTDPFTVTAASGVSATPPGNSETVAVAGDLSRLYFRVRLDP